MSWSNIGKHFLGLQGQDRVTGGMGHTQHAEAEWMLRGMAVGLSHPRMALEVTNTLSFTWSCPTHQIKPKPSVLWGIISGEAEVSF